MVSFILPGNSASGEYEVANSLRFEPNDNDHLERDPSSSGNRSTFTISFWMKISEVTTGTRFIIGSTSNGSNDYFAIRMENHKIECLAYNNGSKVLSFSSNVLLRDPSAWYHIVTAIDTTQGTEANRFKMYLNGSQITSWATSDYPSVNATMQWNHTENHFIGCFTEGVSNFRGYLSEIVNIDGSQLDVTSFGKFDSDSPNIWKPKNVSGLTFGTNGFYLNVPGASTGQNASGMGGDSSGNDHHFASSGLAANSQTTDTCTNNFCTFTSNFKSDWTLTDGGLKCERTTGTSMVVGTSIMPTTGKWYFEVKIGEAGNSDRSRVGVMNYQSVLDNSDYTGTINTPSQVLKGVVTSCKVAKHFEGNGSSVTEYTASGDFADNDIIQFAMDLDNKAIYIGRNGTFLTQTGSSGGDPTSGSSKTGAISTNTTIMDGSPMTASTGLSVGSGTDTSTMFFNFGNPTFAISSGNSDANGYGNFEYSVPSGYYSLCTKNLAEYG